jgi:peroxiredoxin
MELGTIAPAFTLKGTADEEVTLASFRGEKNVVLVFYTMDSTPG